MASHPPHTSARDIALVRDLHRSLVERVGDPDAQDLDLDALTAGERALYVLMASAEHVHRGGFEQLYFSAPAVASEAATSARLVQARAFERLFVQADEVAFAEPPRKRGQSEFRRMMKAVESGDAVLLQLDDAFDGLMADPGSRLEAYLSRYVRLVPGEYDLPEDDEV